MPGMARPGLPPAPGAMQNGAMQPGVMQRGLARSGARGIPPPDKLPELMRPNAPTLRVLESLMPPPGSLPGAPGAAGGFRGRRKLVEVVDGEAAFEMDGEDDEFLVKRVIKKRGGKRKVKVTAEMKRKAAAERKRVRDEEARANMRDKEEIFEVRLNSLCVCVCVCRP
jgi:hypothetical protein